MAGETTLAIVGNLTADPELRTTQSGKQVCNVTVASTPRVFDKQTNQWTDGRRSSCAAPRGGFRHAHRLDPVKRHARHSTRQAHATLMAGRAGSQPHRHRNAAGRDRAKPALRHRAGHPHQRQQGHQPAGGYTGGASFGATVPTAGPQAPATDPWGQPTDGGAAFGAFGTPGDDVEKEPEF